MKAKVIDLKKYMKLLSILWMSTLLGCYYIFKFLNVKESFIPTVFVFSTIAFAFMFITPYFTFLKTQLEIKDGFVKFGQNEIDLNKLKEIKRDFFSLGYVKVKIFSIENIEMQVNLTYPSSKKLHEYLKQNAPLLK